MTCKNTFLFEMAKNLRIFLREGWRRHPLQRAMGFMHTAKIEPTA